MVTCIGLQEPCSLPQKQSPQCMRTRFGEPVPIQIALQHIRCTVSIWCWGSESLFSDKGFGESVSSCTVSVSSSERLGQARWDRCAPKRRARRQRQVAKSGASVGKHNYYSCQNPKRIRFRDSLAPRAATGWRTRLAAIDRSGVPPHAACAHTIPKYRTTYVNSTDARQRLRRRHRASRHPQLAARHPRTRAKAVLRRSLRPRHWHARPAA